jgi:hypothetical protein
MNHLKEPLSRLANRKQVKRLKMRQDGVLQKSDAS